MASRRRQAASSPAAAPQGRSLRSVPDPEDMLMRPLPATRKPCGARSLYLGSWTTAIDLSTPELLAPLSLILVDLGR